MNRPLLRKLRRDIWTRKGALLALLGIIAIGVGVYVGMAAVYRDLDGARERYYRTYRLADFYVDLKRLPQAAVDELTALPNVRAVRGRVNMAVLIDLPGIEEPIPGNAISLPATPAPVINDVLLRSGTWFSGRNEAEVILNAAFAAAHGIKPGDHIKALLLDKQHELLVVGTAMSPEFVYVIPPDGGLAPDPARAGVLFLSTYFLRESSDLEGAYNQVIGQVHDADPTRLANTLELIAERLDLYGVTQTTAAVDQPSVRFLQDELTGLKVQSRIMPMLFLGVAALILNVLMGRLVAQQRTVIGTLRALGYGAATLVRHYLAYGLAIGAAGGVAGGALGLWLQAVMIDVYRDYFALPGLRGHFYPDVVLTGLAVSLAFAVAGTLKGAYGATRLLPADAMRPPPPERGGRVLPERIPFLWRPLPFGWKLILRTVFRNPFRSTVSLLASTVATALMFTALSMVDSLDYLMSYEFERIAHQDLTIGLRDPESLAVSDEVRALPAVVYTEAELSVVCDLRNGSYQKRIGVTGLRRNNRLYTPLDGAGRPIPIPQQGLILSRKLAEILHLQPGDTAILRPLIGRRIEVRAVIAGTVESFLGLSAYANLDYLSRLLGEAEVSNMILAKTVQADPPAELLAELKKRPEVIGIGERTRALEQLDQTFGETMNASITVLVLFAGMIAFGAVLNAVLVSLSERQREVGTLRVLGYSPAQITGIFAGESALLNGLGLFAGLYAGVGLARAIAAAYSTELYRFPAVILTSTLCWAAVLMALFIGLAQLIVHRLVLRLDWLAVLNVRE